MRFFSKAIMLILAVTLINAYMPIAREVAAQKKSTQKTPAKKYNVLFIASDDLRTDVGAYGNKLVKTPNIDRIAARGTRFDRAYTQYPLCNPSRSSLLTGRYPTQTKIYNSNDYFRRTNPDWVTLPEYFKQNGYVTLRSGKIFHGGIDDQISWTEGGEPTDPGITERGRANPAPTPRPSTTDTAGNLTAAQRSDRILVLDGDGESHGDYKSATKTIEYLEKYKDQPFFLAVGFVKPHSPPTAPKKFFDMYDVTKMPLPVDFGTTPKALPGFPEISISQRNADLFIGRESSPELSREMMRAYYASTSFMDAQVGRVLDKLVELGLHENTIIVFWSDHGYHLGEKGKWSKAYSLYDINLRVPLLIAVPKGKTQSSPRPVQLLDMYPTLAELCGLPRPEKIEGNSIVPLLKNPKAKWSAPAYSVAQMQNGKIGRSIRTERWHYVEYDLGKEGVILTDTQNDPHELKNLADDPKYAKTVKEMKALLAKLPE